MYSRNAASPYPDAIIFHLCVACSRPTVPTHLKWKFNERVLTRSVVQVSFGTDRGRPTVRFLHLFVHSECVDKGQNPPCTLPPQYVRKCGQVADVSILSYSTAHDSLYLRMREGSGRFSEINFNIRKQSRNILRALSVRRHSRAKTGWRSRIIQITAALKYLCSFSLRIPHSERNEWSKSNESISSALPPAHR